MPIAARTLVVLSMAVAAAAGCSWTEDPPGDITLEEARALPGSPPYFLGKTFEGLPLTAIFGPRPTVWFIYGDCEQPPGEDVGGCNAPLSVEVWPIEENPPGGFPVMAACRKIEVRGAPGALYANSIDAPDDNAVTLYVGDQTISIGAGSQGEALRAAQALRTVEEGRPSSNPLPAPSIAAADGLARCS